MSNVEEHRLRFIEAAIAVAIRTNSIATVPQIAAEAGLTPRQFYNQFPTYELFFDACKDYFLSFGDGSADPNIAKLDRKARIERHVDTRILVCQKGYRIWRWLRRPDSPGAFLLPRSRMADMLTLGRIEMVYTSELLAVSEKERSAIVIAISSLIHYEAWELLTEHHGLSPDEVATIWKAAIDRLLPVERP